MQIDWVLITKVILGIVLNLATLYVGCRIAYRMGYKEGFENGAELIIKRMRESLQGELSE